MGVNYLYVIDMMYACLSEQPLFELVEEPLHHGK